MEPLFQRQQKALFSSYILYTSGPENADRCGWCEREMTGHPSPPIKEREAEDLILWGRLMDGEHEHEPIDSRNGSAAWTI